MYIRTTAAAAAAALSAHLHQLPALQGHGLDGDLEGERRKGPVEGDVLVRGQAYLVHVHDGFVSLQATHAQRSR